MRESTNHIKIFIPAQREATQVKNAKFIFVYLFGNIHRKAKVFL